jgi:hypothetical protein
MRILVPTSLVATALALTSVTALAQSAAVNNQPAPTAPATPQMGAIVPTAAKDKVVCKYETQIGSLVQRTKRCHTRAEWDKHTAAGQAIARSLVEDNTGRPTTN